MLSLSKLCLLMSQWRKWKWLARVLIQSASVFIGLILICPSTDLLSSLGSEQVFIGAPVKNWVGLDSHGEDLIAAQTETRLIFWLSSIAIKLWLL